MTACAANYLSGVTILDGNNDICTNESSVYRWGYESKSELKPQRIFYLFEQERLKITPEIMFAQKR